MRYWDTSALLPLLVQEKSTEDVTEWLRKDSSIITWWASEVECWSALARLEREAPEQKAVLKNAFSRLKIWRTSWHIVQPTGLVKESASRLLRVHSLRTADALQLAAASIASQNKPDSFQFVSLDHRLSIAAEREGFDVLTLSS